MESTKKNKGSNPKLEVSKNDITEVTASVLPFLKVKRANGNDAVEVEERLNDYFNRCHQLQRIPTIEGCALALGISRQSLWNWLNGKGCSQEVTEVIQRVKTMLSAIDSELALRQKISPVVYIFRSKNFYNMSDSVVIESEPTTGIRNIEDISKRYVDVIDVDTSTEESIDYELDETINDIE